MGKEALVVKKKTKKKKKTNGIFFDVRDKSFYIIMSSVESTQRIELLLSSLERNLETFKSVHDVLNLSKNLLQSESTSNPAQNRLTKRNYIVDSFKLDKSHKEFKNWESETRLGFIQDDLVNYNQVVAKIAKINQKLNESSNTYEALAKTIQIPDFTVSIKTLEKYGDEKLLELGKLYGTPNIQLVQLFSLNTESANKLFPEFSIIQDLINIEYRLRIEKRVHLEILTLMKNKIQTQNRTWTVRDNQLKDFLDIKVQQMIKTVEEANAEDSKAREEEEEDEDEDDVEEGIGREVDSDDGTDSEEGEVRNIEELANTEHDNGVENKLYYEESVQGERRNADEGTEEGTEVDARLDTPMNELEPNSQHSDPNGNYQNTKQPSASDNEDDEMLIDQ